MFTQWLISAIFFGIAVESAAFQRQEVTPDLILYINTTCMIRFDGGKKSIKGLSILPNLWQLHPRNTAILERSSRLEAFYQNHKLLPWGWAPHFFIEALTPEVSERWVSLYLEQYKEWDSHVSLLWPLRLSGSGSYTLKMLPVQCPPFIHHDPYNVGKKYAAVSIIFHGCRRAGLPFVLEL